MSKFSKKKNKKKQQPDFRQKQVLPIYWNLCKRDQKKGCKNSPQNALGNT